jgi:chorismate mutase/prephenate dehydratase
VTSPPIFRPARVAFLGPPGTFTDMATRELFPRGADFVEAPTIEGVFDAIRHGAAARGVVPIENSTEGSVTSAVDALIEGGLFIRRELVLEISHCLMSVNTRHTQIQRVYSHPQALAQCRDWLAEHLPAADLVPVSSTAAAAQEALKDSHAAAIGSRLAAELSGLPVLCDGVQDLAENATRFALIAPEDAPRTGDDKTTIAFAVRDSRGALRRVLEVLDDHGISLTRIESRPSRQKAWDYVFLADLAGHRDEDNIAAALRVLGERCPMLRNLGSYPRFR